MAFSVAFYITLVILGLVCALTGYLLARLRLRSNQIKDQRKILDKLSIAAVDYIYVYDLIEKKYFYNSTNLFLLLGYEEAEKDYPTAGLLVSEYLHPDDIPIIHDVRERIKKLKNSEVAEVQFRLRHKNGEYLWFSNSVIVFSELDNGKPNKILGAIKDITKLKSNELELSELLKETQVMNEELKSQQEELRSNLESTITLNDQLKESEVRYEAAERLTKLGTYELIFADNHLIWSKQLYRNLGLFPEEVVPSMEFFKSLLHPEDQVRLDERELKLGGDPTPFEFRVILKDGQERTLLSSVEAKFDKEGNMYKVMGAVQDITERKMYEQHIQELLLQSQKLNSDLSNSQENLRKVLDNTLKLNHELEEKESWLSKIQKIAQVGNFIYDFENDSIYWSDEVFSLLQIDLTQKPLSFEAFISRIHQEDQKKLSVAVEKAIKDGDSYEVEVRQVFPNGKIAWIYCVGYPFFNGQGKFIMLGGLVQDIDQRKKAEIALQVSEQFFKALIQNSSDHVLTVTESGKIIYQSPTMYKLTGYYPEEREGKTVFELIHPEDAPKVEEYRKEVLKNPNTAGSIETRILKKDKKEIWIEATITNLLDQPGVNALVVNTRDITERKKAEEKLKQQNQELTKINAELDAFVYRASHDLRAPLSSILGLISITKSEKEHALKDQYLELMEKSVLKLDLFIRNIIDYSRNTRVKISQTPINFEELIQEVFEEYKYMTRSELIVRNFSIEGDNNFHSDLFRLKIIFSNIISNAIRYSNPRVESFISIHITITENNALIKFEDNGIGIRKDSVDKIFDMFYRASEYNVGSGLGLYIVREVIHGLGGTITVDSVLGQGTTFQVTLPNMEQNEQPEEENNKEVLL